CDRGLFGGHPSQFDVVDHHRTEDPSLTGPADQAIDGHDEKHHGGNTEEWQRFFGTAALSRQLAVSGLGTESSADGAVSLIPLDVDCRSASVAGGVTPQSPAAGRSGVGLPLPTQTCLGRVWFRSFAITVGVRRFVTCPVRWAGCSDAAELPVSPERRRDDFFGFGRLSADITPYRGWSFDDRVREAAEPFDLHGHLITGFDRPRSGRCARQDHVTRQQGDGAGEVRNEVWHVPHHVGGRVLLTYLFVHERADGLVAEIPFSEQARAQRAQGA